MRIPVLAAVLSLATCAAASATPLNIDFGSASLAPDSSYGAAAGADGVGYWNQISGFTGTPPMPVTVLDTSGNNTGAQLLVSGTSLDMGASYGGASTDFQLLMGDAIVANPIFLPDGFGGFTVSQAWNVSITGISSGLYDVYLYEYLDPNVETGQGNVSTTVGGLFASINGSEFATNYIQGSNYLLFTNVDVQTGALTVTTANQTGALIGFAGMQLVQSGSGPGGESTVPEPASMILLGSGLAGLYARRRRSAKV